MESRYPLLDVLQMGSVSPLEWNMHVALERLDGKPSNLPAGLALADKTVPKVGVAVSSDEQHGFASREYLLVDKPLRLIASTPE